MPRTSKKTISPPSIGEIAPDKIPKIDKIISRIKKAKDIDSLDMAEKSLTNYIDPEKFGFDSIQDLLYTNAGLKELKKILGHSPKIGKSTIDKNFSGDSSLTGMGY